MDDKNNKIKINIIREILGERTIEQLQLIRSYLRNKNVNKMESKIKLDQMRIITVSLEFAILDLLSF